MKILLLYFSGTYNTLFLTNLLKSSLMKKGHKVDVFALNDKLKVKFYDYDIIGIGYPIHYFNAPSIVNKILKRNNMKSCKYFIYKNGYINKTCASSLPLIESLSKYNNELLNEYHFIMPSNINFSFKEEFVAFLLRKNAKYVDYIAENITSKKEVKYTLIEKLRSKLNKKKLDSIINQSKNFTVDKDKCIRCRRCTSSCPTSNIKYDKFARKIIFLNRCQACNRCVTYCPSNSIDAYKLSSLKIDKTYNFISCLENKLYDFKLEKDKFYLSYKCYFEKIESL